MKENIIFFILIALFSNNYLLCQEKEKYPSKEKDDYYNSLKSYNYKEFQPIDANIILNFVPKGCKIKEIEGTKQEILIDFQTHKTKIIPAELGYIPYDINKLGYSSILKREKKDSIEALIYYDFKYEERFSMGEPGIWIGYSENYGKNWKYYYSGIVLYQPVFVKWYSQRPLITDNGKLQIDIALMQQLTPFSMPISTQSYKCIKDGIYLEIDLDSIRLDSDNDGLTDIAEEKLHLNPFSQDTDNDGISDNLDLNPCKNFPRTEKSKLFEAIVEEDRISWKKIKGQIISNDTIYYASDLTETVLIVTDDEDLMGIQPQNLRVIFMTSKEYENVKLLFHNELNNMNISRLFKVDNKKNLYKISNGLNTWGSSYLIKKTKKGWQIQILSTWIF
jgi:hypothetical protein